MTHEGLSPETVRFIRTTIDSVGQLEILLLLHARAGQAHSAAQIDEILRSNVESVERRLAALVKHGVIAVTGTGTAPGLYRYAPSTPELGSAVDVLAEAYAQYRGRVIDAIYSPREPMRSFADSFRIKKDSDHDG